LKVAATGISRHCSRERSGLNQKQTRKPNFVRKVSRKDEK